MLPPTWAPWKECVSSGSGSGSAFRPAPRPFLPGSRPSFSGEPRWSRAAGAARITAVVGDGGGGRFSSWDFFRDGFLEAIPLTFLLVWAGLAGLACGSFANVLAYRIPRGVFFRMGSRSHCPLCGDPIPWWDNIPLLSFFLLGGRCKSCRGP
ncbi:MAG TPA: prepilin peptidase, partial [Planctomycetes bacterium]|nr:prepilin peptidase [Planctomycetota bacterium]